jgi:hypothetical protein
MSTAFIIEDFTPVLRNTLRGFARVRVPSGTIFHDVTIHQKDDAVWASPASKPMIGRDGTAIKDEAGKITYAPVVTFSSREIRDRWSSAVIEALRASHPEALA